MNFFDSQYKAMKVLIKIIFAILFPLNVFGQTEDINAGKYHPAKEIFETKYEKKEYHKFLKSQIIIEENKVILSTTKSIEFSENSDSKTKLILMNGLLDPYEINRSYKLRISSITELPLLNPNPQTKRFKFWIFYKEDKNALVNSINPHEYYFELQNENSNEKTSFEDFVNGAKLTFLKLGGIII